MLLDSVLCLLLSASFVGGFQTLFVMRGGWGAFFAVFRFMIELSAACSFQGIQYFPLRFSPVLEFPSLTPPCTFGRIPGDNAIPELVFNALGSPSKLARNYEIAESGVEGIFRKSGRICW